MRTNWSSGDLPPTSTPHESSCDALAQVRELELERELSHAQIRAKGRARYRQLRARHFLTAIPTLAVVITAAIALTQIAWMNYGWTDLFGGHGNILTGGGMLTSGGGSIWGSLGALGFLTALLLWLPTLAEDEEKAFRSGAQERGALEHARSCVIFGLVHMLMGVGLGVALALALGGASFTLSYLRGVADHRVRADAHQARVDQIRGLNRDDDQELRRQTERYSSYYTETAAGVAEATRAHLAYNAVIIGGIWLVSLASLILGLVS